MSSSNSNATPLLYACVAHQTTILAEETTSAASAASSLASLVLPKIDHATSQKVTYTHGSNHIHYISETPSEHATHPSAGGLTFLVVAESTLGRRIPFAFLLEIRNRFFAKFPEATFNFGDLPNYGAASFNPDLKSLMIDFGTSQNGHDDALNTVKQGIEDVRGIMTRNIEGLMERGERMDQLVDRTDRLGGNAQEFRVRSRGLKRGMWWKNVKLMATIGAVVALIILLITLSLRG
ncbi:Vesicle-associated membrane protein 714 [Ceratocystis lukuohia]|uniref:Synaptobrevin homolog YKT6 n=1 Tax=Ceratocystis lukuohia TaxID=2019550 RepID=A0ABR4M8E7_9PEZI